MLGQTRIMAFGCVELDRVALLCVWRALERALHPPREGVWEVCNEGYLDEDSVIHVWRLAQGEERIHLTHWSELEQNSRN